MEVNSCRPEPIRADDFKDKPPMSPVTRESMRFAEKVPGEPVRWYPLET